MKLTLIAAFAALLALPAYAHDGVHIMTPMRGSSAPRALFSFASAMTKRLKTN
jgi:hypothetical protein